MLLSSAGPPAMAAADRSRGEARARTDAAMAHARQLLATAADVGGFQRRFLDQLRPLFTPVRGAWTRAALQAHLGRVFPVYLDDDAAMGALWAALQERVADADETLSVDFGILREALEATTATRMAALDAGALEPSVVLETTTAAAVEEVARPRLQGDDTDDGCVSLSSSVSAGAVLPGEFTTEVLKKSQNWLGRWRVRYLTVRWGELEMAKKSLAPRPMHSFPASTAMASTATTGSMHRTTSPQGSGPKTKVLVSPRASTTTTTTTTTAPTTAKVKRYALQNLLSLQLISLSENDPNRRQVLQLHFKQATATGGGHTTKALVLGCERGGEAVKALLARIATLALFHGIAVGESPAALQRYLQVGADVHARLILPASVTTRLLGGSDSRSLSSTPLTPLQLAWLVRTRHGDQLGILRLLQAAHADPRSLLWWHFARWVSSTSVPMNHAYVESLAHLTNERILSPTAVGDDADGWTLLMFACAQGNVEQVDKHLDTLTRHGESIGVPGVLQYISHVNGGGDTALHMAIKGFNSANQAEECALRLIGTRETTGGSGSRAIVAASRLVHISDGDGNSVCHLALRARMWRLVSSIVDGRLLDPASVDAHGNTILHLALKVCAPSRILNALISALGEHRGLLEAQDRGNGDTALTLAIKHRREDVVADLLRAGVNSSTPRGCRWSTMDGERQSIRPGESPLHVAISTGLAVAASSLLRVAAAAPDVSDYHGSSVLALAIRHGLYALALQVLSHGTWSASDWMDPVSGWPVSVLALQAGQWELAAVILDTMPHFDFDGSELLLEGFAILAPLVDQTGTPPPDRRSLEPALMTPTNELRPRRSRLKSHSDSEVHRHVGSLQERECHDRPSTSSVDPGVLAFSQQVIVHFAAALLHAGVAVKSRVSPRSAMVYHLPLSRPRRRVVVSSDGKSPMNHLAASGPNTPTSLSLVALLLSSRNSTNEAFSTPTAPDEAPVELALRTGSAEIALLLLLHDPTLPSSSRASASTLLHLACEHPCDPTMLVVLDWLLEHRPSCFPGSWDADGWTPMHVAIRRRCDARAIRCLHEHHRDLNMWSDFQTITFPDGSKDTLPLTPLMLAVEVGNLPAFRALVGCGAELRLLTPQSRLDIFAFAARKGIHDADFVAFLDACRVNVNADTSLLAPSIATSVSPPPPASMVAHDRRLSPSSDSMQVLPIKLLNQPASLPHAATHAASVYRPPRSPTLPVSGSPPRSWQLQPERDASPPRSPLRSPTSTSTTGMESTPQPTRPVLDDAVLNYLRDEERATLTLVAQEARLEAQTWLAKRIGQKKLLSEARALLQNQSHRRTGSGTITFDPEGDGPLSAQPQAELLAASMEAAAKRFIDKHVAEAVADARMEIEREKQILLAETGVYPGLVSAPRVQTLRRLPRTASLSGSMLQAATEEFDLGDVGTGRESGWWSEGSLSRAGTFLSDVSYNQTWLSSTRPTSVLTSSFLGSMDPRATDFFDDQDPLHPLHRDEDEDEIINPLERDSFVRLVDERNTLS